MASSSDFHAAFSDKDKDSDRACRSREKRMIAHQATDSKRMKISSPSSPSQEESRGGGGGGGVERLRRAFILDAELNALEDKVNASCENLLRLVGASPSPSCPPQLLPLLSPPSPLPLPSLPSLPPFSPSLLPSSPSLPPSSPSLPPSSPLVMPASPWSVDLVSGKDWPLNPASPCPSSPLFLSSRTPPPVFKPWHADTECTPLVELSDDDESIFDCDKDSSDEDALTLATEKKPEFEQYEHNEVKLEMEEYEKKPVRPFVDLHKHAVQQLLLTYEQIRKECCEREREHLDGEVSGEVECERRRRTDLKVAGIMRKRGLWVNQQKVIGHVPGVHVGDCFNLRIQMCIIGLHKQQRAGIDYILAKYSAFGVSVAISVVISTEEYYSDNRDKGETVIYTGQGGLVKGGKKLKIAEDQQLVRGNVGLHNSCKLHVPVRLIRGFKVKTGQFGVLYRYDGLYLVNDMKYEAGAAGNKVYKFLLQRMKNQPILQFGPPDPPRPLSSTLASPSHLASSFPYEEPVKLLKMSAENSPK